MYEMSEIILTVKIRFDIYVILLMFFDRNRDD